MADPRRLAGCKIRISGVGGASTILIAPSPPEALTEYILLRGHITVALSFEAGVDWPYRSDPALMADALEAGRMLGLQFASVADALKCEAELYRVMEDAR